MKKKSKKYLNKYYEWMNGTSYFPGGLCSEFEDDELLDLFRPTKTDSFNISYKSSSSTYRETIRFIYWAADGVKDHKLDRFPEFLQFTPLRQTIVLFMAAMNGEL